MDLKLTNKNFDELKKVNIDKSIVSTEANFYLYPTGDNIDLLKMFFIQRGNYIENKAYTLRQLIKNKDDICMDEIVFPDNMVYLNDLLVGFTMPYVDGINLDTMFNCDDVSNKEKIRYLKEIGFILHKMKKVREEKNIDDFYINDLHSANFMVDNKSKRLKVIDVDSFKINNNLANPSKNLSSYSIFNKISKYAKERNLFGGLFEIDENTEIFCYIATIFKFLFNVDLKNISLDDYYEYLDLLSFIGASKELIDIFYLVATEENNQNPCYLLDELEEVIPKCKKITCTK